jgi:hypothetical protein
MEQHINNGEVVVPREVYDELKVGNDDLFGFVKSHAPTMVKELDEEQAKLTFAILAEFRGLVELNRSTPEADPYVIALAQQKGWKVVTCETLSSSSAKPKIPNVCSKYKIPCLTPLEFIETMKWDI